MMRAMVKKEWATDTSGLQVAEFSLEQTQQFASNKKRDDMISKNAFIGFLLLTVKYQFN